MLSGWSASGKHVAYCVVNRKIRRLLLRSKLVQHFVSFFSGKPTHRAHVHGKAPHSELSETIFRDINPIEISVHFNYPVIRRENIPKYRTFSLVSPQHQYSTMPCQIPYHSKNSRPKTTSNPIFIKQSKALNYVLTESKTPMSSLSQTHIIKRHTSHEYFVIHLLTLFL